MQVEIFHSIVGIKGQHNEFKEEDRHFIFWGLKEIFIKMGGNPIDIGGHKDHIHILHKVHNPLDIPHIMIKFLNESVKWLNDNFEFQNQFTWHKGQVGLFVPDEIIAEFILFIENQHKIHSMTSFREELKDIFEIWSMPNSDDIIQEYFE